MAKKFEMGYHVFPDQGERMTATGVRARWDVDKCAWIVTLPDDDYLVLHMFPEEREENCQSST